ncbi:MAG: FixH family protein, partial [Phenylobacterium sp.]|nr:FixH family protein [Phenylobacterium sp.]
MSAADTPARPGIRGWHVLAGVSAFFAVIIAVDASFAVLAIRTFPGQVSVTPYEDGLLYNRHIAQLEAQARLGWRA